MRRTIGLLLALAIAGCPSSPRGTTPVERESAPTAVAPTSAPMEAAHDVAVDLPQTEPTCTPSEPSGLGEPIPLAAPIVFDFDHSRVRPESFPTLDALAETLTLETRFCRVDVVVHAMRPEYPRGQRLGHLRAHAIRDGLVRRGIDAARLRARGLDDAERNEDRRVEIVGHEDGCPCPPR